MIAHHAYTQHCLVRQYLCGVALGWLLTMTPAWCRLASTGALPPPITSAPQPDKAVHHTVLAHAGSDQVLVIDNKTPYTVGHLTLPAKLRAGPFAQPKGTQVFFVSEGGWISRLDMQTLQITAEKRFDHGIHHAALSGDGQYLVIANDEVHTLTMLDNNLEVLKKLPIASRDGQRSSRVLSILTAPTRQSFVVVLRDLPEVWEISYNPTAPEIPMGVIHDFQYREGAFAPGFLNPMRTILADPVAEYALAKDSNELVVTSPENGEARLLHLDVRRPIARWTQTKMLRWSAGQAWDLRGQTVLAAPAHDGRSVMVVNLKDGHTVRDIPIPGRLSRIASHVSASHLWCITEETGMALSIIDKETLDVVGQHAAQSGIQIEALVLSADGQRVFSWDTANEIRVFDEKSRREINRLDFRKPPAQGGGLTTH